MDYGLRIDDGIGVTAATAKAAEGAGFESCWVTETNSNAFVAAAAAVHGTERVTVSTGIALAFPRSPTLTAMAAWDLDELSGGRFMLGLGSQVKRVNELRFSTPYEHPVAKLKEYVEAIRVVWAANRGDEVGHEGPFYTVSMPALQGPARTQPRNLPIFLAAVRPRMAGVCGEVADGLLAHPLASPDYIREVIAPAVADGLERAGRGPGACSIAASPLVAISDDVEQARRETKLQIAFWATTRTYQPILELHGRGELVPKLREAFGERDRRRMIELVDDDLLDLVAATGTADDVLAQLRRWEDVADRVVLGGPRWGTAPERVQESQRLLIEAIATVTTSAA